jgi:hypothetical protein
MRILILSLILVIMAWSIVASASTVYPSVAELEQQLHLVRGGMFPREVLSNGVVYRTFYLRGCASLKSCGVLRDGEYAVIVKLEK